MKRLYLHTLAASALVIVLLGCATAATPTPIEVIQYPATWTPAPTPTNTPPGPTATLVIQHTPGPPPTRDPNVKRMPSDPSSGVGIWLEADTLAAKDLADLAANTTIFASAAPLAVPHGANQFVLHTTNAEGNSSAALPTPPAPAFDGALIANAPITDTRRLAALHASITPRLAIAESDIKDATSITPLRGATDGICFCNFLREADAPMGAFKKVADWQRDVATLASLSADPNALVLTATRFPDNATGSENWFNYSIASFLLGQSNAHSFFGFQGKGAEEELSSPFVTAALGAPEGGMFQANSVFQRRFARGLVLVNPSADEHAFALARNYTDLNGQPVTEVTMAPYSGVILLSVK